MPDRKNDILKRLIESDLTRSGGVYNPPSAEAAVGDLRGYLGQSQPLVPDDFGGRVPQTPAAPQVQPDFSVPDRTSHGRSRSAPLNPPSFGEAAAPLREAVSPVVDAFTSTAPTGRGRQRPAPPEMADAGIPMPPPPSAEPQAGLSFAGVSPAEGPAPREDIMFATPRTPTEAAGKAGLEMVMQGEQPPVSANDPDMYDPDTGLRSDDARKLGLLERMFGEKGSDKYQTAGKALMMAGAAIMSSQGSLGEAVGQGIQAGLMTYDDAMQALKDEEKEARQMGMAEEAHALNMQLKQLQIQNAGKRGSIKPEKTLQDRIADGLVLADLLENVFEQPRERALSIGAQQGLGLPAGTANPPRPPAEDFLSMLGQ